MQRRARTRTHTHTHNRERERDLKLFSFRLKLFSYHLSLTSTPIECVASFCRRLVFQVSVFVISVSRIQQSWVLFPDVCEAKCILVAHIGGVHHGSVRKFSSPPSTKEFSHHKRVQPVRSLLPYPALETSQASLFVHMGLEHSCLPRSEPNRKLEDSCS